MIYHRPLALDLFCGAGGVARGLQQAGFRVVGVDVVDQPRYAGNEFHRDDALRVLRQLLLGLPWRDYLLADFALVWASPPCQSFTAYRRKGHGVGDDYPDLIAPVREMLERSGRAWVIENVEGAPLRDPIRLCGSSFGLDVRRHRLFESNISLSAPPCDHSWQTPRFPAATNRAPNSRCTVEVGVWRIPLDVQQRAMGIDWMELGELSEAIPPAYSRHIGEQIIAAI